ncbi:MAG: GNAT family N-acetyltransferase [Prevotella sp.]|nr:GNAT family N-acetyltransferase [Alistipes senegalensis]MCM1358322.1 GNAT family N-acetyltransferase [Prevotella sp.]MCM1473610.1 GNAT family N-acetyltransferase [Muribaculaceae bacterium]
MNNYIIRKIKSDEYKILDNFLYEAIFIPESTEKPPFSIIEKPELQVYVENFGKKDDYCLIAELNNKIIGAVWVLIMDDYGHIDNNIPSLAISLYKEFRGQGIGTALLESMLLLLKSNGYEKVSLSVQKENYAYRMYLKAGFEVVDENEEEYIMVCNLQKK